MCFVHLRCDGSEISTILNEFIQKFKEKERFVVASQSGNFYHGLSRAAKAKKSDRKACVIMHVQSNVLLLKPIA